MGLLWGLKFIILNMKKLEKYIESPENIISSSFIYEQSSKLSPPIKTAQEILLTESNLYIYRWFKRDENLIIKFNFIDSKKDKKETSKKMEMDLDNLFYDLECIHLNLSHKYIDWFNDDGNPLPSLNNDKNSMYSPIFLVEKNFAAILEKFLIN